MAAQSSNSTSGVRLDHGSVTSLLCPACRARAAFSRIGVRRIAAFTACANKPPAILETDGERIQRWNKQLVWRFTAIDLVLLILGLGVEHATLGLALTAGSSGFWGGRTACLEATVLRPVAIVGKTRRGREFISVKTRSACMRIWSVHHVQTVTGGAPGEVGVATMPAIVDRLGALYDGADGERAWSWPLLTTSRVGRSRLARADVG